MRKLFKFSLHKGKLNEETIWNFQAFMNSKKNSCCGNYMRKYGIQIVQYPGLVQWKHWALKWKHSIFSMGWNIVSSCNHTFNKMPVSRHKIFLLISYKYFLNKTIIPDSLHVNHQSWILSLWFVWFFSHFLRGCKSTIIPSFFCLLWLPFFHKHD